MQDYYKKAIELLHKASTENGFVASVQDTANYQRVWARDGVICGLAALASRDLTLIDTFKSTLNTLHRYCHQNGTVPSNVYLKGTEKEVSYGGLAGRVDAQTWYVIGVCEYVHHTKDFSFLEQHKSAIEKVFSLLEIWEFNNRHLVYVPLSGNWADEYIVDGYVLYDQLLRLWALRSYNKFYNDVAIETKIEKITNQIATNFFPNGNEQEAIHPLAYKKAEINHFAPCSFSPSGYKNVFDAFAHSLLLLLDIGESLFHEKILAHSIGIYKETALGLLPAFWPPIFENEPYWDLLKDNCKYEFRNYPYEFHNAGSWPMVNGFYGMALLSKNHKKEALEILCNVNNANAMVNHSFFENFNTNTQAPNGVAYCTWSAAGAVLLHQSLFDNFKINS
ncbi:fructofuranosidase/invertase [Bergeyella sp. RCAD1439]|uniref:fructofuranosidase/invertase n=1 Tax=Bergeyella anatis TaxID=3113737 RepID=UPI002E18B7EE|nr:fructofuranosidase/invertase [Bergeyella sp. RCAD1439]